MFNKNTKLPVALLAACLLAACGGSGDSGNTVSTSPTTTKLSSDNQVKPTEKVYSLRADDVNEAFEQATSENPSNFNTSVYGFDDKRTWWTKQQLNGRLNDYNAEFLIAEGFTDLILNKENNSSILSSIRSTNKSFDYKNADVFSATSGKATVNLTGTGVEVAVVDNDWVNKNDKTSLQPNIKHLTEDDSNHPVEEYTSHGVLVADVIANAKYGLAPDVNLFVTGKLNSLVSKFRSVQKHSENTKIIAASLGLSSWFNGNSKEADNPNVQLPSDQTLAEQIQKLYTEIEEFSKSKSVQTRFQSETTQTSSEVAMQNNSGISDISDISDINTASFDSLASTTDSSASYYQSMSVSSSQSQEVLHSNSSNEHQFASDRISSKAEYDREVQVNLNLYAEHMRNLALKDKLPLVVQSAGNAYHQHTYAKNYTSSKDSVWYGQRLNKDSLLTQTINNPNLANNWIVVTGAVMDKTGLYRYEIDEHWKAVLADANYDSVDYESLYRDINTYKAYIEQLKNPEKFKIDTPADGIYPSYYAWQCGDTKFSCLATSMNYYASNDFPFFGTSASAPQVAGAAALVAENFPWIDAPSLKTTILTTATDVGPKGVDEVFGWGLLNVYRAVKGPMVFFGKDFNANMSRYDKSGTYYFTNNITGQAGLKVNGKGDDWLVLTGKNSFAGDTLVQTGNLVVGSRQALSNPAGSNNQRASLTSKVFVSKSAAMFAVDADLSNVTNSGYVEFTNSTVGNYTGAQGSIVGFSLANENTALTVKNKADFGSNSQVIVKLAKTNSNGKETTSYIPQNGKTITLVKASSLTGDVKLVEGNQALVQVKLERKGNELIANFTTNSGTRAVSRATNVNDEAVLRAGSFALDNLMDKADVEYNNLQVSQRAQADEAEAQPTNQDNLITAANLQTTLQAEDLQKFLLATSGNGYANLQRSAASLVKSEAQAFNSELARRYVSNDQNVHAYLTYNRGIQNWSQADSVLTGEVKANSVTAGAFKQLITDSKQAYNLGVFATTNSGNYKEQQKVTSANKTQDKIDIVTGEVNSYGVGIVAGLANTDSTTTLGVNFNHYNYQLDANTHDKNYLHGKFKAWDINLVANQNFKVYARNGLFVSTGVKGLLGYYRQGKFTETVDNNAYKALASQYATKGHINYAFDVYGQLNYLTQVNKSMAVLWFAGVDLGLVNDVNFKLENGLERADGFKSNFLAQLNAGARVTLSDKFSIQLSGNYKKTSQYADKNVRVTLDARL